jgi:hypothetical protein
MPEPPRIVGLCATCGVLCIVDGAGLCRACARILILARLAAEREPAACGTQTARTRHWAHGEVCDTCGTEDWPAGAVVTP